jgi:hypothetical protein
MTRALRRWRCRGNSFFASSYSFTGTSREGDLDVLATGDDMTPHFF